MLRKVDVYPLSSVIDDRIMMNGAEQIVIHTEQSLVFNLDVHRSDTSIQEYIQKNLSPSQIDTIPEEQLKGDNVFDLVNPLSSRFITDRAMRANLAKEMQAYLEERKSEIEDQKNKEEIKTKYDNFIKSLG